MSRIAVIQRKFIIKTPAEAEAFWQRIKFLNVTEKIVCLIFLESSHSSIPLGTDCDNMNKSC